VSNESNGKLSPSSDYGNEGDKEESNELNYDQDKDQLGEEQEEATGEITSNQVF
jgi:hypothetical protein